MLQLKTSSFLSLALSLPLPMLLMGISQCPSTGDEDGDDWTTEQGDCDDTNANVHPEAYESCDALDNDCDGTVDEGYDADCNFIAPFGAPASDAPGGMRVKDSSGNLYYTSYGGGMYRVPAGGGTSQLLFTPSSIGAYGFLTNTYVLDDGRVTFYSGLSGIMSYDPTTAALSTWLDCPDSNGYAFSHFMDADGNIGVGTVGTVIAPDGALTSVSYLGVYSVTTPEYVYTLSGSNVYRYLHNGTEGISYGSGLSDAYGLAIGADGSLYVGQGNTNPSTIFKIPPGGGSAIKFATVPIAVTSVISDTDGYIYASGWGNNSLYRIDPSTGASSVYGCDPYVCP